MIADHFDELFRQQRDMQRMLDSFTPRLELLTNTPRVLENSFAQLAKIPERLTLPAHYLQAMPGLEGLWRNDGLRDLSGFSGVTEGTSRLLNDCCVSAGELVSRAEVLWRPGIDLVRQSVADSLAFTSTLIRAYAVDEHFAELALQPQLEFQRFAQRELLLTSEATETIRAASGAIIEAAARLLEPLNSGFGLAAVLSGERPITTPPGYFLNVYSELAVDLERLRSKRGGFDPTQGVEESASAQIAELGARMIRLIWNLNVQAERDGERPVFKPTSNGLIACALIPTRMATDQPAFGEIVDHLFFLLYEGSGNAKRLTTKVSDRELEALWTLKHLRLGLRHDVDHGSSAEVEAKQRQIGAAFRRLIGCPMPRSRREWVSAQLHLYRLMSELLEKLWLA